MQRALALSPDRQRLGRSDSATRGLASEKHMISPWFSARSITSGVRPPPTTMTDVVISFAIREALATWKASFSTELIFGLGGNSVTGTGDSAADLDGIDALRIQHPWRVAYCRQGSLPLQCSLRPLIFDHHREILADTAAHFIVYLQNDARPVFETAAVLVGTAGCNKASMNWLSR